MDPIKEYYESIKGAGFFVDEADFRDQLSKSPKDVFQTMTDVFVDFDDFETSLGLKKKDGGQASAAPQLDLQLGAPKENPALPPTSELLKRRKQLVAEKETVKPIAAPGFVPTPQVDYDKQIGEIDDQIKQKGFKPEEIVKDFSDLDIEETDDYFNTYKQTKQTKPINAMKDIAGRTWGSTLRSVAPPEKQPEVEALVGELKRLPLSDIGQAFEIASRGYDKIVEFTGGSGDARDKAIKAYEKDLMPTLGKILLRDRSGAMTGKDLPIQLELMRERIFNRDRAPQTEELLATEFTDPDAKAAKQRKLYDMETKGLGIISNGIGLTFEDENIPEFDTWLKLNKGTYDALAKKAGEAKDKIDPLLKQYGERKKALDTLVNSPEYQEIKAQEEQVKAAEQAYNDAPEADKTRMYDLYKGEVDKYNIMSEAAPDVKEKVDAVNNTVNQIKDTGLTDKEISELESLSSEYNRQASTAGPVMEQLSNWTNFVDKRRAALYNKYPAVLEDEVKKAEQDFTGQKEGALRRFDRGIVDLISNTGSMASQLFRNVLGGDIEADYRDLGRSQAKQAGAGYTTAENQLYQSPYITVIPDNIREELSSVDSETKRMEIIKKGFQSGAIYQTTNPNSGDFNLTAGSVVNTMATVMPQILGAAGLTAASGGGTGMLFVTTAMQAFSPYYNEAVEKGIANPVQYATAHTLVDAGTEILGTTDLKLIKGAMSGKTGFGATFFKDLTQGEFDKLLAGSKKAFKNYAKAAGPGIASNITEAGEEYIASIGGDVVNKYVFGENPDIGSEAVKEFVTTSIGTLPLTAFSIPSSVMKADAGKKIGLYNAAADLNNTLNSLKDQLDNGAISQKEYADRVKLITEYSAIVRNMPKVYENGNPMRDADKVIFAFNQFIASRKKDGTIPPAQEAKIDEVINKATLDNENILNDATKESAITEGPAGGDIIQPQGAVQGQPGQGEGQATQPQANVGDSDQRGQGPVAGARLFNEPNPQATELELEFKKSKNIDTPEPAPIRKLDESRSMAIADAYDALVDSPNDPEVQQAYQAMADETMDQFKFIKDAGITVELWTGQGEPYANSEEMIKDVRDNKHMYVFSTEEGFGDNAITDEQRAQNALLRDSGEVDANGKKLLINDVFRFVHDFFGHTRLGNSFGAIGEENAWNVHARMYSPLARRAMTTETRGQNSWVNFNKNLRNADGTIKKKGDEGYIAPRDRPFADQKMALLPEEFSQIEDTYSAPQAATETVPEMTPQQSMEAELRADLAAPEINTALESLRAAGITARVVPAAEFEAIAGRIGEGMFLADNGEVIFNEDIMGGEFAQRVVWHEFTHPVINTIRNTDRPLYDRIVRGFTAFAEKNADAKAAKDWAEANNNDPSVIEDEFVTETIASVADGTIDLTDIPSDFKIAIYDLLNKIAKILGLGEIKNMDEAKALSMAKKIANALTTGQDIREVVGQNLDISRGLGQMSVGAREAVNSSPVSMKNARAFASESSFDNKVEFKNALQDRLDGYIKDLKKTYGKKFDPSVYDEATMKYLSEAILAEAVDAISQFPAAVGWYDEKTQSALSALSTIHPEIATDMEARGAFILPLAVMSNGNKVDKNFELAEEQYQFYKNTGRFNPNGEFGLQQSGIKKSLSLINLLLDSGISMSELNNFFTSKHRSGDLKYRKADGKLGNLSSGELASEPVYGAVILGPKIGNGFYMNLWGQFDQLTMDRWFMRTWGRLTGTLIEKDPEALSKSKKRMNEALASIKESKEATTILRSAIGTISGKSISTIASEVEKASMKKSVRNSLSSNPLTNEIRKAGNNLSKLMSGEKEAPSNGNERKFIRDVFSDVKNRLASEEGIDITMADLQAVLWYPEKILYESFKSGETFDDAAEGYTEESAPDYFNSAKKLAKKLGATDEQINQAVSSGRGSTAGRIGGGAATVGTTTGRTDKEVLARIGEAKRADVIDETAGTFEPIEKRNQMSVGGRATTKDITGKLGKDLIDDGDGNYVFLHYSPNSFRKVDPRRFGSTLFTGRDEQPGVGLSMFYVKSDDVEGGLRWDYAYVTKVPKGKVYPFNEDPLGLIEVARKEFRKEYGEKAAFDPNKQVGFLTKVAADRGFLITVAKWNSKGKKTFRAQTTEKLPVEYFMKKEGMWGHIKKNPKYKDMQLSVGNRIAPNGRPSNLNAKQYEQVRTPEFKAWFGDWEANPESASKALDENGEPLVLFHGTKAKFDQFEYNKMSWESRLSQQGPGFYMTDNKKAASQYGKPMNVFANVRNPLVVDGRSNNITKEQAYQLFSNGDNNWFYESYLPFYTKSEGLSKEELIKKYVDDMSGVRGFDKEVLQNIKRSYNQETSYDKMMSDVAGILGKDGVIEKVSDDLSVYVAFTPNQIKSATENIGTFSTEDDRIQMSAGNRKLVGQINWEVSPEGKGDPSISARNPVVMEAANNLKEGKITNEEYRATVSENSPIRPITRFFEPATEEQVRSALSSDKVEKVNTPVQNGTVVGLRLDIPAYSNNNTWVVSVHEGDTNQGKAISYSNVARIKDVNFGVEPKGALNIAAGKAKSTIGRMFGKWDNIPGETMEERGENAKAIIQDIVDNPEWVQIGMNPFRYSYFYDRNSDIGRPVKKAEEVVQVGGLVYAKNPEYGNWTDEAYRVKGLMDSAGQPIQFSAGQRPQFSREFKLAAFVMRKKAEGETNEDIKASIQSVSPVENIDELIDNPEQFLRNAFPDMTELQKDNIVELAKIQNVYRGRKFGKPTEFTGLQVPQEVVDEYLKRNKVRDATVREKYDQFADKWLSAAKGLPRWTLELKALSSGAKNIEIARAEKTINRLRDEAKRIGFTNWKAFSKALSAVQKIQDPILSAETGLALFDPVRASEGKVNELAPELIPPEIAALPDEIIPYVYRMRGQIDALTKDLVGMGFVSPEQAVILEKNIGQYVNRSYKLYSQRNYKPDEKAYSEAVKYLTDVKLAQLVKDRVTDDMLGDEDAIREITREAANEAMELAKRDVEDILAKKPNQYIGKDDSRNLDILKQRKDIPEPIRKLMGQNEDPGVNFMMTVAKQAALKSSSMYLAELRRLGMGTIFFEKDDPRRPAGTVELPTGETKKPIDGLYTFPEIEEALNAGDPTYNSLTQAWMKAVGFVRWGKTIGSVVTQFKNFESNLGFAVMNGLLMTGSATEAFKESAKYVKGQYSKDEISAITEKAIKLDLVGQSVGLRELKEMMGSGDVHDIALDIALSPDGVFRKRSKYNVFAQANKLYRMGDDFWKVYAYLNERQLRSKAMFEKDYSALTPEEEQQVDKVSAEIVKDTWPTYDRVVEAAKFLSKRAPIFGNFISFQAESARVLANTIRIARRDLKDPATKALGVRRMVGIASYFAFRTAATLAAAKIAGIAGSGVIGMLAADDDEEAKKRALKSVIPPFMRTEDILPIQGQEKHKYTVYSMSSIDPYALIPNSLNAFTDGREGIFGDMEPGVTAAMFELFSPFAEPEMTYKTVSDVLQNRNPKTGDKLIKSSDDVGDAIGKVGGAIWNTLEPSTIGLVQRLYERDNKWAELSSMAGARPYDIDLHEAFTRKLSLMGKNMEDISREYFSVKLNKKSTPEEVKQAELDAENSKAYEIQRMNQLYRDLIKLGANPDVLNEIIEKKSPVKVSGFDKTTKSGIKTGKVNTKKLYK